MSQDNDFPRLVSLACHDLRTPLATVFGFARTLERTEGLGEPTARYVGMISQASEQLGQLLDELGLVARIEAGRYEPALREIGTDDLAAFAREQLGEERVEVSGSGAPVRVDVDAMKRAITALVRCTLRHGAQERVDVAVDGPELRVSTVTAAAAPVVLGEDLRDLGAAAAVRLVGAIGGSVAVEGGTLTVRLPQCE